VTEVCEGVTGFLVGTFLSKCEECEAEETHLSYH